MPHWPASDRVVAETYWQQALRRSDEALVSSALVPLSTSLESLPGDDGTRFELRHLTGAPPRHLRAAGPKPNPFRPWDGRLQVATLDPGHVIILNKYPVQIGHMLLITSEWAPQQGWLTAQDWQAVHRVDQDTTGLWFFNSGPAAGASQPHRHLQLLPRASDQSLCPREHWFENHRLADGSMRSSDPLRRSCFIQHWGAGSADMSDLFATYLQLCRSAGLGSPESSDKPLQPYNLLFCRRWMALILRSGEGMHGFSVNALGFAGYLLSTKTAEQDWLAHHGPNALLRQVVRINP